MEGCAIADASAKVPENVDGPYFVDDACTACETCVETASDRSFYYSGFADIHKKATKSSRFAHEIFTDIFSTEKRQPS